jgi:isocitrate lyase
VDAEGKNDIDFLQPIVADAEAGFGGVLNAFELMKAMIEAGAAGVHFEDQLASVKKCGHMGGKVLVPTREAVEKLVAARLAADVMGVPTLMWRAPMPKPPTWSPGRRRERPAVLHRRAHRRRLLQDPQRPRPGHQPRPGLRALRRPGLVRDRQAGPEPSPQGLRRGHPRQVPGQAAGLQLLALVQLEEEPRRRHHRQVPAEMGAYGLQVPVHHAGRLPQPELLDVQPGLRLRAQQMSAFVELQEAEFAAADRGFTAVKHQREVGTGYFDAVTQTIQHHVRD